MAAKPNEIEIIRVYDAPVKLVWEAWTDPAHAAKWWGPRGFTITTKSKDLKPGGKWIYTMHGPDGTDYPNISTYHEVVKYQKLVYDHGGNEERQKLFTVTVTFKEDKGKTVMHMIMALPTAEEAEQTKKFIKQANGNSTWDRLAEYLENQDSLKAPFYINRNFSADIKTVFEMWSNPEHFAKWLGPKDSQMSYLSINAKEGGSSHAILKNADGLEMYSMFNYKKINPYNLFIYTQNFCDKNGKLSKPPFMQNYPDMLLTTVTFAEEYANQTRVTVKWEVYGDASEADIKGFNEIKSSMTQGWNQSFDKIDDLLEKSKI